jgi:outer membrane protein TolC
MIRSLLFCLIFGTSLPASAQDSARSQQAALTLEEAVSIAQGSNRNVKIAQLTTSIDDDKIAEARTYRFPSVNLYALGSQLLTPIDFTFNEGAFGRFPGIGPVPATQTKIHTPLRPTFYGLVQFSQPLSQQYKIGLNIKQAKLSKLVDEQRLRAQRQAVTNQVKQAYYAILQTQSALAASDENLKFDRELDRTIEQYVAQKTALKSDSMDMKAKIAQEEYNNIALQDTLATQKERLNDFLGRDIRTDFQVAEVSEATTEETNIEVAQTHALASRPELNEARLNVQQGELNRRITKTEYIPDVSLTVNNLSLTNVNLLPNNVVAAGVLVSWDPLDWGRRRHELAAADKAIEQSRKSMDETEAQILVDVGAKFRKLRQTRALLRAADLQLESEQEKLRVVMNQFQQTAALLKDVLQQKSSVENATNQRSQALLLYWTAKADFEKSLGED